MTAECRKVFEATIAKEYWSDLWDTWQDAWQASTHAKLTDLQTKIVAKDAEIERHQVAILQIRKALGLHRDSTDNLLDVIENLHSKLACAKDNYSELEFRHNEYVQTCKSNNDALRAKLATLRPSANAMKTLVELGLTITQSAYKPSENAYGFVGVAWYGQKKEFKSERFTDDPLGAMIRAIARAEEAVEKEKNEIDQYDISQQEIDDAIKRAGSKRMSDLEILPCPMCGSPAKLDYTGVMESYHDWQTGYIECTRTLDEHCGMDLVLHMDYWHQPSTDLVLIAAWNRLARENTKGKQIINKPSEALRKNHELTQERLAYYNSVMTDKDDENDI